MTVVNFILGIQYIFLLYFLALYATYLGLDLISLLVLPRYMQSRVMSDLPQSGSGFDLPISICVAAYNEEATIVASVRSLLQLSYSEFELVIANDGSKDQTLEVLKREFKLVHFPEAYRSRLPSTPLRGIYVSTIYPNLRVIDKENGGRSDSLNAAINVARYPLICVIDADSVLQRDSLQRIVQPFLDDPRTIACGGTIRIANGCKVVGGFVEQVGLPTNLLVLCQVVEYLRAFLFGRLGWSPLNGLLLISGAFGLFHKESVINVGGYDKNTIGEDMDLTMRLHRMAIKRGTPYRISFVPDAVLWTEVPETFKVLRSQRIRWQHGLGECISLNRSLFFKRGSGAAGWVAMPFNLVLEWLGPLLEVGGYVFMVVTYLLGLLSFSSFVIFLLFAIGLGTLLSICAVLEEEFAFHTYPRTKHILILFGVAILENFGYRQLNAFWRLEGLFRWMLGKEPTWGQMTRTASWQAKAPGEALGERRPAK